VAGGDQTVDEDAPLQTLVGWATAISAGPGETQTLTFSAVAGTPALSANLDVHGVRVDREGHLYYLDFLHHVVNVIEF